MQERSAVRAPDQGSSLSALATVSRWVPWREELRGPKQKPTKVPYDSRTLRGAKADNPATWGTRAEALAAAKRLPPSPGLKGGIGIMLGDLGQGWTLAGVDLDSCLDPATGEFAAWAADVINRLDGYAETSPSGRGVKVLFRLPTGEVPALRAALGSNAEGKLKHGRAWTRGDHLEIALHLGHRYFAVTGRKLGEDPDVCELIGVDDSLPEVASADVLWLIREAGPAFVGLRGDATGAPAKGAALDMSGSGYGYRFMARCAATGANFDAAIAAILEDEGAAGEWANRSCERQLRRAWKKAVAYVGASRADALALIETDSGDAEVLDEGAMPAAVEPGLSPLRQAADRLTPFGDVSNGARHADRLRGQRLYVSTEQRWLTWTGQSWAAQSPEEVAADTKETSAALLAEAAKAAAEEPGGQNQHRLVLAGRLHASAPALGRMEQLARSEPGMSVHTPADFDTNPFALTALNGILDLRTGELRLARPDDRVSKLAGTAFDANAKAPLFLAFLAKIMPDPAHRAFMQRVAGYLLTGSVEEERFFVAYGNGANGKSVLANVLAAVLGEYAGSFGAALVTRGAAENEAERMKARLPGKRLALVNETAVGDLWDSQRIKELASRERIAARLLYREAFDFWPTHKLFIRTNHLPGSLDAGDGFWRRCVPIPFTEQIAEAERIPALDRLIIETELPGVLNWMLAGALAWRRDGLAVPAKIMAEVAGYREDTDLLGQWLTECTEQDTSARLAVGEAFNSYADFCRSLGAHSGTAMTFFRAMTAKGFARDPSRKGGRRFVGIRLREAKFPDDDGALL